MHTAVGSKRLRSVSAADDTAKASLLFDSKKQKGSVLFGACNLLVAEQEAWTAAFRPDRDSTAVLSAPGSQPQQDQLDAGVCQQSNENRQETSHMLNAAATSRLAALKHHHELEGKLLTSSMMALSQSSAAGGPFSRGQSSMDWHTAKRQAGSTDEAGSKQAGGLAAACASLWAPLQRNRDADKLYLNKKYSLAEMAPQDVRSPRRYIIISAVVLPFSTASTLSAKPNTICSGNFGVDSDTRGCSLF